MAAPFKYKILGALLSLDLQKARGQLSQPEQAQGKVQHPIQTHGSLTIGGQCRLHVDFSAYAAFSKFRTAFRDLDQDSHGIFVLIVSFLLSFTFFFNITIKPPIQQQRDWIKLTVI